MDKELLIRMYQIKDPKRRRKLFDYFQQLFFDHLSAALTVEIINKELGSDYVRLYDVKYIRSHQARWLKTSTDSDKVRKASTLPAVSSTDLGWSEPDELKKRSFKSSKFNRS